MAWRAANSLLRLRDQLNESYPGWTFLGFLGDQAHAGVPSDHNPNAQGVVTALDIGPGGGLDIHALADRLAANPHPDLKYIISNGRIAEWQNGFKWRRYNGSDPHDTHIHVSVGRGEDGQSAPPYDDTNDWNVKEGIVEPADYRTNSGDVVNLYQALLGRKPSDQEINIYKDRPFKEVVSGFTSSPEFKNRFTKTINKGDVINYLTDHLT